MATNCFGFNLSRNKSKSVSKINSNKHDLKKIDNNLSKSYGSDLNKKHSFNIIPEKMLSTQCDQENNEANEQNSKTSVNSMRFTQKTMKLFLNQSIDGIRSKEKIFEDKRFLCFVASIVENQESQLYVSLASRFKGKTLIELNNLIKWRRIKDIASVLQLKDEFVLNNEGKPPVADHLSLTDYSNFFSAHDISQGWIGNCFHIGAIIALMNNEQALEVVIPADNTERKNKDISAYHFRFWKLGYWYSVVIDDYLPVNKSGELIFSYNKIYPNEYWVPLFEKALAKFMGSYDELEGGIFVNSALFLSGGLHDEYIIEKSVEKNGKNETEDGDDFIPNTTELLEILKIAILRKDMIGCLLENDDIAKNFGLFIEHLYLITDVIAIENKNYLKIHNPFNTPDEIKNTKDYIEMEKYIVQNGNKASNTGEFWIEYEDFLDSFRSVKVCNLKPCDQSLYILSKNLKGLSNKTTLCTKWKMQMVEGSLPANLRQIKYYYNDYDKFLLNINGNCDQSILVSFIQDWIKKSGSKKINQAISLRIYIYDNEEWVIHKVLKYESSLQWCLRICLRPAQYLFIYECCYELLNDLRYCFRVFYDESGSNGYEKLVKMKIFEQSPRFDPIVNET